VIDPVSISRRALEAVRTHAADAWPEECCGLLLGTPLRIERAMRARNDAPDRLRRFLIHPADHFAAIRTARVHHWSVIGAYHSHPDGRPIPSATDLAEAFADDTFLHLVTGPNSPGSIPEIAAYRLTGGNFVGVPLVTVP
jgi:proteasome lid subunit RPN8/RPN11